MSHDANPFSEVGGIVFGENFLGRQGDLERIRERVVIPALGGSLAVVGEPRIGKSSLAWNALMVDRETLLGRQKITIWLSMGTYKEPEGFFLALVNSFHRELEDLGLSSQALNRARQDCVDLKEKDWGLFKEAIEYYFRLVRLKKICPIFILDEFDATRNLFKGRPSEFAELRDLAYQPTFRVIFVVTSRRAIEEIEVQVCGVSTLTGIFMDIYVTSFSEAEVGEYYRKLGTVGLEMNDEEREQISDLTGHHPYFLGLLGFELVSAKLAERPIDVARAFAAIDSKVVEQYKKTVKHLEDEDRLQKLLQILFGPMYDVTPEDIAWFQSFGLIHERKGFFYSYSSHFERYLRSESLDLEVWPLWSQTERALRGLIDEALRKRYGEPWLKGLLKARPQFDQAMDRAVKLCEKTQFEYPSRASSDLLVYTNATDLFELVKVHWDIFAPVLKGELSDWKTDFKLLAKVRNRAAHNYDEAYVSERDKARVVCEHILKMIRANAPSPT